MNKIKSVLLVMIFTMLIAVYPIGNIKADSNVFSDISGHWAEKSIGQAVKKGFVAGYPDGTFKPDGNITRAEFIKMVITALEIVQGPANAGDHWYDNYVNAAIAKHFYKSEFNNSLNNPITREEMSLIALRVLSENIRNQTDFEHARIMYEAAKRGLILGMDKTGTLGQDQSTTRAQSITVINRILTVNNGGLLTADKHAISRAEVLWHKTNVFTMLPRYFPEIDPVLKNSNLTKWDPSKVSYQSKDGNYLEALERFVVVDMADPNDPFKPDTKDFKFAVMYPDPNNARKYIEKELVPPTNSYLEVTVMKQHYNHPYIGLHGFMQFTWQPIIKIYGDGDAGLGSQWSGLSTEQAGYELDVNGVVKYADIEPGLNNLFSINEAHGLPKSYQDMPATGGDYLSYNAAIFPYGDLTPPETAKFSNIIEISYLPNTQIMSYMGEMHGITAYGGHSDLSISNKR